MKFSEYIKNLTESSNLLQFDFSDPKMPEKIVEKLTSTIEKLKTVPEQVQSLFKMSKDNLEIRSFSDAIDFLKNRSLKNGLKNTVQEFDFFNEDGRSKLDPKSKSPIIFKIVNGFLKSGSFNGEYISDLSFFKKEILEDLKRNKEKSKFFNPISKIIKMAGS